MSQLFAADIFVEIIFGRGISHESADIIYDAQVICELLFVGLTCFSPWFFILVAPTKDIQMSKSWMNSQRALQILGCYHYRAPNFKVVIACDTTQIPVM